MLKRITALIAMLSMAGLLSACNTVEGMGKDVEAGGEAVQDTARDVKQEMKN